MSNTLRFERQPFPCNRCGACCRAVADAPLTAYLADSDGACRHLDRATQLCIIYENRPDICRVDKQYTLHFQDTLSWRDFCTLNESACAILRQRHPMREE